MLDGDVYRASGDGYVELVDEYETTAFAVVTYMDADATKHLENIPDCNSLYNELDRLVEERGINRFYMIRIDGLFREVNVRSVPAQEKPYKRLVEVLEQQQTFFDYENIEGTIVGLYCPPYMSHLNAVGWHMHFISKDKTKGGHVLGLNIADAVLTWDDADSFQLKLPKNEKFDRLDLTVDQSKDIEKIEKSDKSQ
jgi:acetolactate decarboxylase